MRTMNSEPVNAGTDYPDPCSTGWYVTDPSTGLTQYVEADAACTARWVAWSRWRGAAPTTEREEAEYAALDVIPAGEPGDVDCGRLDEQAQ